MKRWLTLVICAAAGAAFAVESDGLRSTVEEMSEDVADLRNDLETFAAMWQNAFGSAGFGTEDLNRLELYGRVLLESLGVGYADVVTGSGHDNPQYLARIARFADTMTATNDVWLKEFLTGNSAGENVARPTFTYAGDIRETASDFTENLQYFLGRTIGQFYEGVKNPNSSPAQVLTRPTWEESFLVVGGNQYVPGTIATQTTLGRNYRQFSYWLAEAQRRQIAALSNIVDKLDGSLDGDNSIEEPEHTSDEAGSIARGAIDVPDRPGWWNSSTLGTPGWSVSGSAGDAVVYAFPGATRSGSSGVLAIRFQSDGWGAKLRAALQFCVVVSTAACMVAIIRSEINYWSTLGGSAS